MHVTDLDVVAVSAGKDDFSVYLRRELCGRNSPCGQATLDVVKNDLYLIGVIMACIEAGVYEHDCIIHAVSRMTGRKKYKVELVLMDLEGGNSSTDPWCLVDGLYHLNSIYRIHEGAWWETTEHGAPVCPAGYA